MAAHSSILAWKIPWAEEPDGPQSMGSQRVWHDWAHAHHIKGWIHLICLRQDWWIRKGICRSSILRAAANPANHTVSSIIWMALCLLLVSESMPWILPNSWHSQDCYREMSHRASPASFHIVLVAIAASRQICIPKAPYSCDEVLKVALSKDVSLVAPLIHGWCPSVVQRPGWMFLLSGSIRQD